VDLELSAVDLDADGLLDRLEEEGGCPWTTLFPERSFTALRVCEVPVQRRWELFVLDDDGTGAWAMTAAVGEDLPAGFTVAAGSLAALWGVVLESDAGEEPPPPGGTPGITPRNRDFNEVVNALTAAPEPLSLAATGDWACAGSAAELSDAVGIELTRGAVRLSDPPQPLCWWHSGPRITSEEQGAERVSLSIDFETGAGDAEHEELADPAALQVPGPEGPDDARTCYSADPFRSPERISVAACSVDGRTTWRVVSGDPGDEGLWVLSAYFPADEDVDQSAAVLALLDLADASW
jgi:hypothetical protein